MKSVIKAITSNSNTAYITIDAITTIYYQKFTNITGNVGRTHSRIVYSSWSPTYPFWVLSCFLCIQHVSISIIAYWNNTNAVIMTQAHALEILRKWTQLQLHYQKSCRRRLHSRIGKGVSGYGCRRAKYSTFEAFLLWNPHKILILNLWSYISDFCFLTVNHRTT